MINEEMCVQVHTSQGKCLIDDYSQQHLALPIPGSTVSMLGILQALVHIVTVNCKNYCTRTFLCKL